MLLLLIMNTKRIICVCRIRVNEDDDCTLNPSLSTLGNSIEGRRSESDYKLSDSQLHSSMDDAHNILIANEAEDKMISNIASKKTST